MTLILKALGDMILLIFLAVFMALVVLAVTRSGTWGMCAFWGFIILGLLGFLIDEQKKG
jgi:hypothetical protein